MIEKHPVITSASSFSQAPLTCEHAADTPALLQFWYPKMENHCSCTCGLLTQRIGKPEVYQYCQRQEEKKKKTNIECLSFYLIPVSQMTIFNKYQSDVFLDLRVPISCLCPACLWEKQCRKMRKLQHYSSPAPQ